jgi:predicted amidohydrolase YtcJ
VLISAVGDRANHAALDLAEELTSRSGLRDRRFRIARAQHVRATDLVRFATEHVLTNALPHSILHDGRWIEDQLGSTLAQTSFPLRTLLDVGAVISFGSGRLDLSSPIDGIYAAVTRRTLDGLRPQGWIPAQQVSVEEALRAYTSAAAYVGFAEDRTGRLTVGALADFAVIDPNLLTMSPNDIPSAQVQLTVVGGAVVFDREGLLTRSPLQNAALPPSSAATSTLPDHSIEFQ